MTRQFDSILFYKDGPVAHVVLNRPRVINAYNGQMRDDLYQALEAVRDDPHIRVAVLRGEGKRGFCAGADLSEFGLAPSQTIARQVRWERDIWGLFLSIYKPLVVALHGYVIGSGVEIACLCDIRIASEDAVFGMPEVALGMVPSAGGTQTLARTIGLGKAIEIALTNQRLNAREAFDSGLVHRVVPNDRIMDETEAIANVLASQNLQVISAAKRAILNGMNMPLARGLELEERLYDLCESGRM